MGVSGQQLIVPVGSFVQADFTISATAPITGELQVEIMRDISIGPDLTEKLCGFSLSVGVAALTVGPCTFRAALLTGGELNQYYYRLLWNGTLIYPLANSSIWANVRTQ